MSDFTPIQTQEDFDKAIKKRLEQQEKQIQEQFKDFLSPEDQTKLKEEYEKKLSDSSAALKTAEDKLKTHDQTVADLTKRAEDAESKVLRIRVANENKLPIELADRLVGTTEQELKQDAESLSALIKPTGGAAPLRTNEVRTQTKNNSGDVGLNQLLSQLSEQMNN